MLFNLRFVEDAHKGVFEAVLAQCTVTPAILQVALDNAQDVFVHRLLDVASDNVLASVGKELRQKIKFGDTRLALRFLRDGRLNITPDNLQDALWGMVLHRKRSPSLPLVELLLEKGVHTCNVQHHLNFGTRMKLYKLHEDWKGVIRQLSARTKQCTDCK